MSCSFTNQVPAQNDVYLLPKELDEMVARLHLPALGADLTELRKARADYVGNSAAGPLKHNTYRYRYAFWSHLDGRDDEGVGLCLVSSLVTVVLHIGGHIASALCNRM